MEYRRLGKTDVNVSAICLGTMTWGSQNNEGDAQEQMNYALTQGVNFFDTAEMYPIPPNKDSYGSTEAIIGRWLRQNGNRQNIVLASKAAGPGPKYIRNASPLGRQSIEQAVDESLKRLQTDYIDLYQLHWPNRSSYHFQKNWHPLPKTNKQEQLDNFLEVLETLNQLVKLGKVRHAGLSNESAWGTMSYLKLAEQHQLPRMVSIQNEYSLLCRLFEPELREVALVEQCGLLAWSPLCRGFLSGKYLGGARPKGSRLAIDPRPDKRSTPSCEAATAAYIDLAKNFEIDPCQMALAFVLSRDFVTSAIIGSTNIEQLTNNISATQLTLDDEVLKKIHEIRQQFPIPF